MTSADTQDLVTPADSINGEAGRLCVQRLVTPIPFVDSIIHGDNCDVLGQLPRNCIDLVVTSPPYDDLRTYGGHSWDFYGVAWQLARVLKPGGVIVWVVADQTKNGSESGTSMRQALHFQTLGLNLHDTMIYKVRGTGAKGSNLAYWQAWEYMLVLSKGNPNTVNRLRTQRSSEWKAGGRLTVDGKQKPGLAREPDETCVRDNVWEYAVGAAANDDVTSHPAVFPTQLAKDHIASWSKVGDLVLDPFSGSGTTCKAAKELERHYIGIEINETYIKDANARTAQDVLGLG
jgi:hypothetical protein